MTKMLTTKEVSEKLHMGINQTRNLIKRKDFPKVIIGPRKWLIPEDSLDEWIHKNDKELKSFKHDKVDFPCVYFITDGKYVKIGATRNLEARFEDIQSMNPLELKVIHVITSDNIFETESYFHKMFKDKRVRGEWFDAKDEIEKMIENHTI